MLHGMDWDVLEVAVRCWDGFERGWTPHGGNGNVLMGEDEDVKATDEGVAVVSRYQRRGRRSVEDGRLGGCSALLC